MRATAGTGPRGVWGLIAATGAAAVGLYAAFVDPVIDTAAPSHSQLVGLLVVTAGFVVAEMLVVHLRLGRDAYAFSLSEIPLIVGLYFVRPDLLVLARIVAALLVFGWRRPRLRKGAFNLALFALEVVVAVVVWQLIMGDGEPLGPRGWLATAVVALVTSILGSGLVSLAIAIDSGERPSMASDVFSLGQVVDLINANFALVVVYVVSVDWRAGWMLAGVVVVLVVTHRAYERLQRRTESLEQLNRFTREIGRQLDIDAVVHAVLVEIRDAVGAETLQIRLADHEGGHRCWSLTGARGEAALAETTDVLDAFSGLTVDGSLLVPRNTKDERLRDALRAARVRDFLAVPVRVDGEPIGTLAVADRVGDLDTFTTDDARQVQALANHAGVALANAGRADQVSRQAAEREYQATHDELTGLANRRRFGDVLGGTLRDGPACVLLLDLDRFKEINDTLGHQTGDDLLCLVAQRLSSVVPGEALVARFGGDEFAILLPGEGRPGALACASLVTAALARPFDLGGLAVSADASVGIAAANRGIDPVTVVRWADVAMYAAKSNRGGVEVYRPDLDSYDPSRVGLLADLRDAVATRTLTVAYQPKVSVGDGRVHGVEALLRWNHPRHGPVGPDEFIPLAEHGGLITPLTMLVLHAALDQCQRWRAIDPEFGVAVNISPRSLLDPGFVDEVASALGSAALPAAALTLEITENSLMSEPERAIEALDRLRMLGVRLAVDDLGTGYSSLAYLQRLPVQEVKIDRSFLRAMPGHAADTVVAAIIDLGHRLGRHVVAEGVETEAAYDRLRELSCDSAQGFWISRPIAPEAVPGFMQSWQRGRTGALRIIG